MRYNSEMECRDAPIFLKLDCQIVEYQFSKSCYGPSIFRTYTFS